MPKIRLDQYLINLGLAKTLAEAQSLCIQGLVHDSSKQLLKPGMPVDEAKADIRVKNRKGHDYVARSALKLKAAIEHFNIDVKDKICADLGCSTGGFTEVLLEHNARHIYSVDVAYGEFAVKLRDHPQITLLEKTNVRHLSRDLIPEILDIIVCDLSFIGLKVALPASLGLLKAGGLLVALIKPQFELPKGKVGEGGIVRDPLFHQEAVDSVSAWLIERGDFNIIGIVPSPILGAKGNQEFLLYAIKI